MPKPLAVRRAARRARRLAAQGAAMGGGGIAGDTSDLSDGAQSDTNGAAPAVPLVQSWTGAADQPGNAPGQAGAYDGGGVAYDGGPIVDEAAPITQDSEDEMAKKRRNLLVLPTNTGGPNLAPEAQAALPAAQNAAEATTSSPWLRWVLPVAVFLAAWLLFGWAWWVALLVAIAVTVLLAWLAAKNPSAGG